MTEKHPFDFDALKKGDIIPVEKLQKLTGKIHGTTAYALEILKYQKRIQDELELRGISCVVRSEKGNLKILTDAEAAEYTNDLFRQRQRQMVVTHRHACAVDVANLTDEQKQAHDRNILVQGAKLLAMKEAGRTALTTAKRNTPGIVHDVPQD